MHRVVAVQHQAQVAELREQLAAANSQVSQLQTQLGITPTESAALVPAAKGVVAEAGAGSGSDGGAGAGSKDRKHRHRSKSKDKRHRSRGRSKGRGESRSKRSSSTHAQPGRSRSRKHRSKNEPQLLKDAGGGGKSVRDAHAHRGFPCPLMQLVMAGGLLTSLCWQRVVCLHAAIALAQG